MSERLNKADRERLGLAQAQWVCAVSMPNKDDVVAQGKGRPVTRSLSEIVKEGPAQWKWETPLITKLEKAGFQIKSLQDAHLNLLEVSSFHGEDLLVSTARTQEHQLSYHEFAYYLEVQAETVTAFTLRNGHTLCVSMIEGRLFFEVYFQRQSSLTPLPESTLTDISQHVLSDSFCANLVGDASGLTLPEQMSCIGLAKRHFRERKKTPQERLEAVLSDQSSELDLFVDRFRKSITPNNFRSFGFYMQNLLSETEAQCLQIHEKYSPTHPWFQQVFKTVCMTREELAGILGCFDQIDLGVQLRLHVFDLWGNNFVKGLTFKVVFDEELLWRAGLTGGDVWWADANLNNM